MSISGNQLVADTLKVLGVNTFFYVMGGPLLHAQRACLDAGITGIDHRHEEAAALAAHAYARVTGGPGVVMACSGPGIFNTVSGVATAFVDQAPMVVIGGSAGWNGIDKGGFQEIDQVSTLRPMTKWSVTVRDAARIPEYLFEAWHRAQTGTPGPVYLDLSATVLYQKVERGVAVDRPNLPLEPAPSADAIEAAVRALESAERPVVFSGSGPLWSGAWAELQEFVETLGVPVFTTPMARGVIPEDHPLVLPGARSSAFRMADLVIFVGTRLNYVNGYGEAPRFADGVRRLRIDLNPDALSRGRQDIAIAAGTGAALRAISSAWRSGAKRRDWSEWIAELRQRDEVKRQERETAYAELDGRVPIHPIVLCQELAAQLRRDDVLIADGQETLNYSRQQIPVYEPRRHLNSGVFGNMGVGVPYGIGARIGLPGRHRVVVLTGDGALGMTAMELDTLARHRIDVKVVVSNNGGWTADPKGWKPGRDLGDTPFHDMAAALRIKGMYVEDPAGLRVAIKELLESEGPALLNVRTDPLARASTTKYTETET